MILTAPVRTCPKLLITTQDLFSVAFNNVEIPKSKFGLINLDTMYLEHYKLIDDKYLNHKNGEVVDILGNHEILWLKIGKKTQFSPIPKF
jgi:hypothetical protein